MATGADLTPTQRLAGHLLGRPLAEFVAEQRRGGRSWRLVARDVLEATEGEIDVTGETLRGWYPEQPVEAAS